MHRQFSHQMSTDWLAINCGNTTEKASSFIRFGHRVGSAARSRYEVMLSRVEDEVEVEVEDEDEVEVEVDFGSGIHCLLLPDECERC